MTAIQNIGLGLFPLLNGLLRDNFSQEMSKLKLTLY